MPSVLVTGAAGFLGRHVVDRLHRTGHHVTGLDLRDGEGIGVTERADIRRPLRLRPFARADVVVHLAALGGVQPSLAAPEAYHRTNVIGTAHVLAACRAAGVARVVIASSSSVYGHCPRPAGETRAPRPLSPYAVTKLGAEALAASFAGPALEIVVVRPFTVVGPGQRPDMLVSRLLAGEPLRLWDFERDFTPVSAVAGAIARACTAPMASPYEVFNLGTGAPVSARRLLATLEGVTGRPPSVSWDDPPPGEPSRTWADPSRAVRHLGFESGGDLADVIAAQADALRTLVRLT